ncbi:MAG: TnpV protein [Clostridia bacterium]|nr:TnpV protein [Clostridia bacterium]
MSKITYHKDGDYLIPDLIMENSNEDYHIGKYGRLRLSYIKEYKRGLYTELIINGILSKHLSDIEDSATKRIDTIIKQLAKSENINEGLKSNNQFAWVQAMNNIKNRAEEIVYNEIIYV